MKFILKILSLIISEKIRDNDQVMAQVRNNTKDNALKADLPEAAIDAIIEALASHKDLATRLLSDDDAKSVFMGMLYEMLKRDNSSNELLKNRSNV